MNQQLVSRANKIFRRTIKGQAAVMPAIAPQMEQDHLRLLLLVNGFTPLETLSKICPFHEGPDHVALALQTSGLIEEAGLAHHSTSMNSPWRLPNQ